MAKAQAQEPSMEEILASIRRIIADEEVAPKAAPEPEPAEDETISEEDLDKLFASADTTEDDTEAESEAEDDEVLPLTEDLEEQSAASPEPALVEGLVDAADVAFAETLEPEPDPEPEPPAPPRAPEPPPVAVAPPPPRPRAEPRQPTPSFVAPEPAVDVAPLLSEATEGFVATAFGDLAMTVLNRNARTLEDLVQDMLRPMLKAWLDQNLPSMVERMVRAEIERVTRGR